MGPHYIVPKQRTTRTKPGWQMSHFTQAMRKVSCREYGCEWLLFGHQGDDDGFPFVHPAGVACGDFNGCSPCQRPVIQGGKKRLCGNCMPCRVGTSNCPCSQRAQIGHWLPDERYEDRYQISTDQGTRDVVPSEWKDRLGEGVYALHHIKTRGL